MSKTVTIAPVRKSVRVNASQAHAFEVFTSGIGAWWPTRQGIGPKPMRTAAMEARLGGRWYEISQDGVETTVGHIAVWEPPHRFVVSWEISAAWKPDPGGGSEVEVRFVAETPEITLVELEHRDFERMGAESGASIRKDVDGGWPSILDRFAAKAEGRTMAGGEDNG